MALHAQDDVFGYEDSNIEMISADKQTSKQEATRQNEVGDIVCSEMWDTSTEVTREYVCTTNAALKAIALGAVSGGYVPLGMDINTSAGERPTITITGRATSVATGNTYTPDLTGLTGEPKAQALGVSKVSPTTINSGSVSISTQNSRRTAGGAEVTLDIYGGRIESSVEYGACDTTPVVTVDTGWTDNQTGLTTAEGEFATGTISVFKNMLKDT